MKRLFLGFGLLLSGCAYHAPLVSVYGHSGNAFTAPTLCAALVQCLNSNEKACFYDRTLLQTATGQTELEECKEVTK